MSGESTADKARKKVLSIAVPRDELAFRIAQECIGAVAPDGTDATEALNQMCLTQGAGRSMGAGFRAAADAAMLYFHDCVNAGETVQ